MPCVILNGMGQACNTSSICCFGREATLPFQRWFVSTSGDHVAGKGFSLNERPHLHGVLTTYRQSATRLLARGNRTATDMAIPHANSVRASCILEWSKSAAYAGAVTSCESFRAHPASFSYVFVDRTPFKRSGSRCTKAMWSPPLAQSSSQTNYFQIPPKTPSGHHCAAPYVPSRQGRALSPVCERVAESLRILGRTSGSPE